MCVSNLGQPSHFELLLELDHQMAKNEVYEKVLGECLQYGSTQYYSDTLRHLNETHSTVQQKLVNARRRWEGTFAVANQCGVAFGTNQDGASFDLNVYGVSSDFIH